MNMFAESASQESATPSNGQDDQQIGFPDSITIFYPKYYFRAFVMAGMYLLEFLAVDHEISRQDKVLACNRKHVYKLLMHWSRNERDEQARAANMIELLSCYAEAQSSSAHFDEVDEKPSPA